MKFSSLALIFAIVPVAVSAQAEISRAPSTTSPQSLAMPAGIFSGSRDEDVLAAQVLLDRSRHSPGVIDGIAGGNTVRAIRAFEGANRLQADGKIDAQLMDKLRQAHPGGLLQRYTISNEDVSGPFVNVPSGMAAMAKLDRLSYENPGEALAEKFHMSKGFLEALNPGVDFTTAGASILVVAPVRPDAVADVARIEIDKAGSALRAYAADGALVATYPVTIGSGDFPSPSGTMEVRAVASEPIYYFDPAGREWGPDRNLQIAAGPNNPVGSTWIDLTKVGYGIHGTPDPSLIGKTSSHGCVRLTNWDAQALSKAVTTGTKVEFL